MNMRKPIFALLCAVGLSAADAPPPYDVAALPEASAVRARLGFACQMQARSFITMKAQVECLLKASRAYAVAQQLRDMSVFRTYAAQMRSVAADADAGRIAGAPLQKRVAAIGAAYRLKVDDAYAAYKARHAITGAPFDREKLRKAATAHDAAVKACGGWTSREVVAARTACVLKAGKTFADAIALKDQDRFYGYASFLRVNAVDVEFGRRTPAQMAARHQILWQDFSNTIDNDYAAFQAKKH
jgi:hypothetical protein